MKSYTLIGSRDPFTEDQFVYELASGLAREGHTVTLFLVENGALAARDGASVPALADARAAGVEIVVDRFALAERGIPDTRVAAGVRPVELETLVDHLAAGRQTIWN